MPKAMISWPVESPVSRSIEKLLQLPSCSLDGCSRCDRILVTKETWTKLSVEEKGQARHRYAPLNSRGLCSSCYAFLRNNDQLLDYERKTLATEVFVEEYRTLKAAGTTNYEIRQTLKMRPKAFERALSRAKERGLL